MACAALPQGRKIFAQILKLPENPLFNELSMSVQSDPSQGALVVWFDGENRYALAKRK
jgi:hypothetical protein